MNFLQLQPIRVYTIYSRIWGEDIKIKVASHKLKPKVEWFSVLSKSEPSLISFFASFNEEQLLKLYRLFGVCYNSVKTKRLDIKHQFTGRLVDHASRLVFNESITFSCYKPNDSDIRIRNKSTHFGIWNSDLKSLLVIVERQIYQHNKKISRSYACVISESVNLDQQVLSKLTLDEV